MLQSHSLFFSMLLLLTGFVSCAAVCADDEVPSTAVAPLHFIYPTSNDSYFQQRDSYFVAMLKLALEESGVKYQLDSVLLPPMQETRSAIFLEQGRYNVHWLMTNNSHEADLIPIRVPLYKGLIGWRLMLIHPDSHDTFERIRTVAQLRHLTATQGVDWPDTGILKSNGFNVRPSIDWNSLVEVVNLKRADYFPRAVTEIWEEQNAANKRNLVVEEHLALHYPAAYYFFISPKRESHARALNAGLQRALAKGDFDKLFNRFFAADLAASRLDQRTIISISNPLLPPHTPLNQRNLWYAVEPQQVSTQGY